MLNYQQILFPFAYNILGSSEDAKDTIQDVIAKYNTMDVQPANEKNYLIRAVINEAINVKKKKARMQPIESWLPEPVATDQSHKAVELKEMVSYSLLILLERLNPKERAVFILKEAFAYTHPEIAEVLNITVEGARKLLSRAHQKVKNPNPSNKPVDFNKQFELLDQFVNTIQLRDLKGLHKLLSEEIKFVADGGNEVKVIQKLCVGINEVAGLLIYVYHRFQKESTIKALIVNHQPALLYYKNNRLIACQIFDLIQNGEIAIKNISTIVAPSKLKALQNRLEQGA